MTKFATKIVDYITCSDCQTEWLDRCGLCKKRAFQSKKVRITKQKKPITFKRVRIKQRKKSHEEILSDREYWNKKHPRRVVTLIVQGHDAACRCCNALENLTFDHVIPLSEGGENSLRNGQILCYPCNQLKNNRIVNIDTLQEELKEKEKEITI